MIKIDRRPYSLTMRLHLDRNHCACTNPEFEFSFKPDDGGPPEKYTVHVADDNVMVVERPTLTTMIITDSSES